MMRSEWTAVMPSRPPPLLPPSPIRLHTTFRLPSLPYSSVPCPPLPPTSPSPNDSQISALGLHEAESASRVRGVHVRSTVANFNHLQDAVMDPTAWCQHTLLKNEALAKRQPSPPLLHRAAYHPACLPVWCSAAML
ncbi:unnamed protein product [Closterium sp. NIES-65]|nr:unnamed protein product [Closterium sp. NIES-65]